MTTITVGVLAVAAATAMPIAAVADNGSVGAKRTVGGSPSKTALPGSTPGVGACLRAWPRMDGRYSMLSSSTARSLPGEVFSFSPSPRPGRPPSSVVSKR